jgi:hypothetical protein
MASDIDVVGSKEKPKNGWGQNGYQGASSVMPGKTAPPLGNPSVAPPAPVTGPLTGKTEANSLRDSLNLNGRGNDARLEHFKHGGVANHPGMRSRQHSGETVPGVLARKGSH